MQTAQSISTKPVYTPARELLANAAAIAPMRILWIKVGGLWPANSGGRLRSFHIIAELSRRHSVTVITTHSETEDAQSQSAHLPRCKSLTSVPFAAPKRNSPGFLLALFKSWFSSLPVDLYKYRSEALGAEVARAMASGDFDICIADFLTAIPNLPKDNTLPVLFFSHNVEHMIWKRLCSNDSNWLRRAVLAVEWRKMRRYESHTCHRVQLTVAVSADDCVRLAHESSKLTSRDPDAWQRFCSIPTGVDIDYFRNADKAEITEPLAADQTTPGALELVFTGSMDWHPNEDAMLWFMDAILPLIRAEFPAVTLSIVGRNPGQRLVRASGKSQVQVTGTVADIRPWVERATVYIVPLRVGGGTRLKIFEALAMGKAVVSTTVGAEGLPLEEGLHILRADDPVSFANSVIALLQDKSRRDHMGAAGRSLVEEQFSWPQVAADFAARCASVIHPHETHRK